MARLAGSGSIKARIAARVPQSPASRVPQWVVVAVIALEILLVLAAIAVAGTRPPAAPDTGAGQNGIAAALPSSGDVPSATPVPSPPPSPSPTVQPTEPLTPTEIPTVEPVATPIPATCQPTDQDAYVYNPDRLVVLAACVRASGIVEAIRAEADGDLHILLALDAPDIGLLRPANQGVELGDLVVEPVCVRSVTQTDAISTCLDDPDPLDVPLPRIGQHVWMEGRYVLDSDHGDWAELHPLYRWGPLGGSAATPAPTSAAGSGGSYSFYTPPGWDGYSDVDCADFQTHAEAQSFFIGTGGSKTYDPYRLDGDHDGLACERLP